MCKADKCEIKIKMHKTRILPVVLYGFKTWPLTLREEHKIYGVGKDGAEGNIGRNRKKITRWRYLHN
jgi:hypothetical protein